MNGLSVEPGSYGSVSAVDAVARGSCAAARHGEHLTVGRIDHDDVAALGAHLRNGVAERALGDLLELLVDREHDGVALHRRAPRRSSATRSAGHGRRASSSRRRACRAGACRARARCRPRARRCRPPDRRCGACPRENAYDALDHRRRIDAAHRDDRRDVERDVAAGQRHPLPRAGPSRAAPSRRCTPARISASRSLRRSRTSCGATSSCTVSRLCASVSPSASRMSPRGAGTVLSMLCWCWRSPPSDSRCSELHARRARDQREREAARALRWTRPTRLGLRMRRRRRAVAREVDHLTLARHVHLEPLLGDRLQVRATRRDADLRLQAPPLGDEPRRAASPSPGARARRRCRRCGAARRPSAMTTKPRRTRASRTSPARRLLLRAMRAASRCGRAGCAPSPRPWPSTARRVSISPSARSPPQVHTGWRGGQMQAVLHSRKACFTSRSSPEW